MASSVSQSLLDHSFYRAPEKSSSSFNNKNDGEVEVVDLVDDDDNDAVAMAKNVNLKSSLPNNKKSSLSSTEKKAKKDEEPNISTTVIKDNKKDEEKPAMVPSSYAKTFNELLTSIGFMNLDENAYKQIRSNCMMTSSDAIGLTKGERHLADLYKCDSVHHDGCFFTTNDQEEFRQHLDNKHQDEQLYCFYCTKLDHEDDCADDINHLAFDKPGDLAEHILEDHSNRLRFQCNLCFYRAFSLDHILIHQALEHGTEFEETMKRSMAQKSDDQITKFEKLFLQQYKSDHDDEDTEIDDDLENGDNTPVVALCKIIDCSMPKTADATEQSTKFYLKNYGYEPEFQDLWNYENFPLHCAYCNEDYSHFDHLDNLWIHFVLSHADSPIISFDLGGDQISLVNPIDDDDVLETIREFKNLLDENALTRSYDEKLMRKAFDYYGDVSGGITGSKSSKKKSNARGGTKRKYGEIQEDNVAAVSSTGGGDVVDGGEPATKRQRKFLSWLPESMVTRTRTVVGMATTALVALGLYHFAHQIPETVEKLIMK